MKFDVFISHSSRDKTAADAACAVLERAGIRCWIAPRDIRPGGEYGAAIINAIERCRVMVLMFSSSANKSQQIHREIERAVSKGVPIVPVRIEEVIPTKSMEYFLGGIHWLDALTPPIEEHLKQLTGTVKAILQADAGSRGKSRKLPLRESAASAAVGVIHHPAKREEGGQDQPDESHDSMPVGIRWRYATLAAGLCIVAALGGIWLYQTRMPAPASSTSSQPPQQLQKQSALLVPETVPFVRDVDRAAIRSEYLPAPEHKALAISLTRNAFTTGQPDDETAKTAALASCTRATEASGTKYPCEIYAVGNNVVFAGGNPPMPPAPWLVRNAPIERPFASKDLPLVSDRDRAYWDKTYATAGKPKALALAPGGFTFYFLSVVSSEEAIRRALEACGYRSGVACMIIAVDDSFVVPIPTTMKAVGFFHPGSNAAIAPELRADLAQRLGNAPNAWNGIAVGANGRPGLMLNAADERAAIEGALTDCGRQDRNCRVIALGAFSVEPASASPLAATGNAQTPSPPNAASTLSPTLPGSVNGAQSPSPSLPRGWIGVRIQSVTDDIAEKLNIKPPRGALVVGIDENGPAKVGGIQAGDVLLKFGDQDIKESRDLPPMVTGATMGREVKIVVNRAGREEAHTVRIGRLNADALVPESKSVEGSPLPPINVGPAQRGLPQAPLPPITVAPTPSLRPQ